MELRRYFLPIFLLVITRRFSPSSALVASKDINPPYPKAISDLKESIENGLGPMELWIQDAKDMRISLPHDVDAGELRKVILADGAVVTVKGARSVSLRHPIELPLPFNRTTNGFISGLLALAEYLRQASLAQGGALLSLRILKRIAPGLVELSSVSKLKATDAISTIDLQGETTALLTPNQFTTLWPVTSINGSNSNLLGFEALLSNILDPKASKKGSFKLLKADVSDQTFVKISFGVEKKLKEGDGFNWEGHPEWRTKPESVRMHFEVLAKVDGDKVVPERVVQIDPITIEDTVAPSVLLGNVSMSKTPIVHQPPNPFTL
ncbi:hypothetical protein K7X08_036799 [Anisodus acutangulus]|uniref:Uncharacterized protein n=1 Tax=Anisodus acutangulus TaxID=402998 RepID=A0A9Q1LAB9_9SOLA|nr:hypothetical protein K7X08_036799 [Anisodus acutangulus]